jgi:hypothetical protein
MCNSRKKNKKNTIGRVSCEHQDQTKLSSVWLKLSGVWLSCCSEQACSSAEQSRVRVCVCVCVCVSLCVCVCVSLCVCVCVCVCVCAVGAHRRIKQCTHAVDLALLLKSLSDVNRDGVACLILSSPTCVAQKTWAPVT